MKQQNVIPSKLAPDPRETARALKLLFSDGDVVELRALGSNPRGFAETQAGYFDDTAQLAKAILGAGVQAEA